jgi:hypothetical protein
MAGMCGDQMMMMMMMMTQDTCGSDVVVDL